MTTKDSWRHVHPYFSWFVSCDSGGVILRELNVLVDHGMMKCGMRCDLPELKRLLSHRQRVIEGGEDVDPAIDNTFEFK